MAAAAAALWVAQNPSPLTPPHTILKGMRETASDGRASVGLAAARVARQSVRGHPQTRCVRLRARARVPSTAASASHLCTPRRPK